MRGGDAAWHWVSVWARQLGGAVWVRGPKSRMQYLNARAEGLFGGKVEDLEGLPCHRVVRARDSAARPFCAPICPLLRLARAGGEVPPVDLHIEPRGRQPQWLRLVAFTFGDKDDPYVVHCGIGIDVEHGAVDFVRRIASRSRPLEPDTHSIAGHDVVATLTRREREILDLLTDDCSVDAIAMSLHVSPVTVRNHVQHILGKLETHSILEAVAVNLLTSRHS